MKRLAWHLSIPALVASWAVLSQLQLEPFSFDLLASSGVLGFLFYAAPHFLWAIVAAIGRASNAVSHAGFIAANIALIAIALFPLTGIRDPSGLPYQWMFYWPLALVLQIAIVTATALVVRGTRRADA